LTLPDNVQPIGILAKRSSDAVRARQIADDLGAILLSNHKEPEGLVLEVSCSGFALRDFDQKKSHPFRLDTTQLRHVGAGRDLLSRALGKKCLSVIDATAGFGSDSFDFLRRGFQVTAIERVPIIALMLREASSRIADSDWSGRFRVIEGEATEWIPRLPPADVIFVDPMFPDVEKKSAQPRKAQQLLRRLAGSDSGSGDLINMARNFAKRRVVVKRPRSAPSMGGEPDHRFMGRSIRYDVYFSGAS
jgi:16S rRNA (guanine1516-N2)-methyltransferase